MSAFRRCWKGLEPFWRSIAAKGRRGAPYACWRKPPGSISTSKRRPCPQETSFWRFLKDAHLDLSWKIERLERSSADLCLRAGLFLDFVREMRRHEEEVDAPIFGHSPRCRPDGKRAEDHSGLSAEDADPSARPAQTGILSP